MLRGRRRKNSPWTHTSFLSVPTMSAGEDDDVDYRAAGLLPFRRAATGRVEALLQIEDNWGSRRCRFYAPYASPPRTCRMGQACEFLHISTVAEWPDERRMLRLNFLGGKREDYEDDPYATAVREFSEECKELVSVPWAMVVFGGGPRVKLRTHGAYRLYLVGDREGKLPPDLVPLFARLPPDPPLACGIELRWVDVAELLAGAKWDGTHGYHLLLGGQPVAISNLVWSALGAYKKTIRDYATSLIL